MGTLQNLIGQKFGRLTVLERYGTGQPTTWTCKCECGNIVHIKAGNLKSGNTQSCGCLQKEKTQQMGKNTFKDLTGKQFGNLTVISKSENKQGTNYKWKCKCICGQITEVPGGDLTSGKIKSCGCMKKIIYKEKFTIPMIGKRFGKLIVLAENGHAKDGSYNYLCQCDCGNIKTINGVSLRQGVTTSCGCINYSIGEKNILDILTNNHFNFIKEYIVPELNNKRFDFAIFINNKLNRLIEFDGIQHYKEYNNIEWENNCPLEIRQQRDKEKNKWALEHNIPLVRIPYTERDNITLNMIMGDQYLVTSGDA